MLKRSVAVTSAIILVLAVSLHQYVNLAKANFIAVPAHSSINVFSPENTTYFTNDLTLNFSVVVDHAGNSVRYSLDGGDWGTVTHFRIVSQEPITEESFGKKYNLTSYTILCDKVFSDLPDGNHSLTVQNGYVDSLYGHFFENSEVTIYLSIDTSIPEIRNLSIKNVTYTDNVIPLNFTVSKTVSWTGYALDNQANVTVSGYSTMLTGLVEGSHAIVVYANDTVGNMGASQNVTFTVKLPEISKPFPTVTVVAVSGAVAVVVAGLVVYFEKRNRGYNK